MDASKKQREPVAFKNLAELKRFIRPGVEFKTVSHANHADMVGLTRVVTTVQTVGFYSKIKDQPEHPFSTCNHGKGFYTDFGKAGNYIFDGTTVKVKDTRKQDCGVIYELEFYDREQNMEETMIDRKMVNFIREQYPPGTRIRLNAMDDPYAPILPGTEGEVDFVDDAGQLHMKWDNGRSLALIPGEDSFTVLPPKLTTLKLYMPLTADLYERNEYGDLDDSSTLLEGRELRSYVAAEKGTAPDKFIGMFFGGQPITAKEFDALTALRMENTGKVRGVFDVNFDKREFSAVHIMDGWRTWVMRDVSAAVYHATRSQFASSDDKWRKLLDHLSGKEITSAGHLSARNFSFSDEIMMEEGGKLNFYVDADFDVDAAFGTFVLTDKNDDWLNIYANYDIAEDRPCDTLELCLFKGDGAEESWSYPLNAAEQEVLMRKMEEFCQQQTGMSLRVYAQQFREEQMQAPEMQM